MAQSIPVVDEGTSYVQQGIRYRIQLAINGAAQGFQSAFTQMTLL